VLAARRSRALGGGNGSPTNEVIEMAQPGRPFAAWGAVLFALAVSGGWAGCGPENRCQGVVCGEGQTCDARTGQCQPTADLCSPACTGATPVCDPNSRTCKACTASQGCTGATPVCDTAANDGAGKCVACLNDSACSGSRPYCSPELKACVTCTANSGCSTATVCDTSAAGGTGACVGCVHAGHCSGSTPLCDPGSRACVACIANTDCGGATPVCDLGIKACVQCLTNAECSGPTAVCDTGSRSCVACASQLDCTAPQACLNGSQTCGLPESCSAVGRLAFAHGSSSLSFVADTTNRADDLTAPCSSASGRDVVYVFTLTEAKDVRVQVAGGAGVDPVVWLTRAPCAAGTTLSCSAIVGTDETLSAYNVQPGDVYLVLEGYDGDDGPMQVTVELSSASVPPANDTCATAQAVNFGASNTVTFRVNTALAEDDESATCSQEGAKEVVYRLTLGQPENIYVKAEAPTGFISDPVLYLRSGECGAGTEVDCQSRRDVTYEELLLPQLPAGEHFLFVEGYPDAAGPLDVTIRKVPPLVNETCSTAQALTFTGGTASFRVDLTFAQDDAQGSCNTLGTGPEAVYLFSLNQPRDVTISATAPTGSQVDPVLFVRGTDCSTEVTGGCKDTSSDPEILTLTALPAGDYFLFVESYDGMPGSVDVTVTLN
jgi:hypothetical protein